MSECSKLAQKEYKIGHDWLGKVIQWEVCKKLKFEHVNKWYMHNPESVLENETHIVLRDFKIQTDNLISVRGPDWETVNEKENLLNSGLCHLGRLRSKFLKKRKERKIPRPRTKKTMEHSDGNTNSNWFTWNNPQKDWKTWK